MKASTKGKGGEKGGGEEGVGGESSPRQAAGPDSAEPAGSQQIPLKQPPGTCAVGGDPLPARIRCMHIQACGSRQMWQAAR